MDNLSFARLVMHNAASKGSKSGSLLSARLPSPMHEWRGSNVNERRSEELDYPEKVPLILQTPRVGDDRFGIRGSSYLHLKIRIQDRSVSVVSGQLSRVSYIQSASNPEWITCIDWFVDSAIEPACILFLRGLSIDQPVHCICIIRAKRIKHRQCRNTAICWPSYREPRTNNEIPWDSSPGLWAYAPS